MALSLGLGALLLILLAPLRWLLADEGASAAPAPGRSSLRACLDYTLLAWVICAALGKLSVLASFISFVVGPITSIPVLTDGSSPISVPETVQALILNQLYANVELLALPLLVLAAYLHYVYLNRRWSPAESGGAAAAA